MSNESNIFTSVIISSAVLAALVTSITNIIVSILNNRKLKIIEKQRKVSEIDKYRYTCLYEILTHWYKHDFEFEKEYEKEKSDDCFENKLLDYSDLYNIIKPLLDRQYVIELDKSKNQWEKIKRERDRAKNDILKSVPLHIEVTYFTLNAKFKRKLEETINLQLEALLIK